MALEIANVFHAVGMIQGELAQPVFLGNVGFLGAITRVGTGVYRVSTEIPVDFGEALCYAQVPEPAVASAQVIADGQVEIRCAVAGLAVDVSQIAIAVLRYRNGEIAIPPIAGALFGPVATTVAPLDLFLDIVNGSDANSGLTAAQALATIAEAERRIPTMTLEPGAPVRVHIIEPGLYPMAYMRPRILGAPIMYFADDAINPAVWNTIATPVAGALTTGSLIDGAFVANAHDLQFVEFLDGAAVGQRRSVRNTTATTIVPARAFLPAPAPGDTYRIFTPAVRFDATTLPGAGSDRRWMDGGNGVAALVRSQAMPSRVFAGIDFDGGGFSQPVVSDASFCTYGCRFDNIFIPTITGSSSWYSGLDGNSLSAGISAQIPVDLLGVADQLTWAGWGSHFTASAAPVVDDRRVVASGVWSVVSPFVWERGDCDWLGGQWRINTPGTIAFRRCFVQLLGPASGSPVPRIEQIGAGTGVSFQGGTNVNLGGVNRGLEVLSQAGIGIELTGARGTMRNNVTGASTGAISVSARRAAYLELFGLPVYGQAVAADWDNGNGAPQNKGFFAAAGVLMNDFAAAATSEGSVIQRVT